MSKQNQSCKSAGGNPVGFKMKQKSHSIESQSKNQIEIKGPFGFDLDNKENYPSDSSLHQNKSKPLSEK